MFGSGPPADPFYDDFENYSLGEICGQTGPPGGWEEWSGSTGVCGSVTDEEACGSKSLKIVGSSGPGGDDMVHRFNDFCADWIWTYSMMTYVPNDATGSAYFIMLADYPPHGPFNWAVVIRIDADLDIIESEWGTPNQTPRIRGRWVEMRIEIDFPADVADYYYDGVAFDTGQSWTNRVGSPNGRTLRAIALYGNEPPTGTTGVYFDNVCLLRPGFDPPCPVCRRDDPCDCNCDGVVDANDIEFFIGLLFNGDPQCLPGITGDTNGDGLVNAEDIEGFINCLFP